MSYEVLANIYKSRRHHKIDEWHTFCDWIESLPYSELITGKSKEESIIDKINSIGNVYVVSPEEVKAAEEESLKKHFEKLTEEGKR